ncbi:Saposin B-type domain-containing protein [Mycena kentingensis (nom. inval.)]|nr:Saposin B-type domain-containing protein [Mycena kentingensis (nom. inval.)]
MSEGTAPAAPHLPPLDGRLGCIVIGSVLGTFLWGIGTLQTFYYFRRYGDDSWKLKSAVAALWFLELGHTISLWHGVYLMVVTFYGQIAHVINPPRSIPMTVFFSGCVNLLVQSYFALRIRTLSKSWLIPGICTILTVARFCFGTDLMVEFWRSDGFAIFETKLKWLFVVVTVIGPSVDIIIACSLCYYLYKIRSRGNTFKQTRKVCSYHFWQELLLTCLTLIDTLILWSVETTSVTCLVGVAELVTYLTLPKTLVWIVFYLMQARLFSNSLLAHLNGRERLRGNGTTRMHSGSEVLESRVTRQDRHTHPRAASGGIFVRLLPLLIAALFVPAKPRPTGDPDAHDDPVEARSLSRDGHENEQPVLREGHVAGVAVPFRTGTFIYPYLLYFPGWISPLSSGSLRGFKHAHGTDCNLYFSRRKVSWLESLSIGCSLAMSTSAALGR